MRVGDIIHGGELEGARILRIFEGRTGELVEVQFDGDGEIEVYLRSEVDQ